MIAEQVLSIHRAIIQRERLILKDTGRTSRSSYLVQRSRRLLICLANLARKIPSKSKIWSRPNERLGRPDKRRQKLLIFGDKDSQKYLGDAPLHKVDTRAAAGEFGRQPKLDYLSNKMVSVSIGKSPTRAGQASIVLANSVNKGYPLNRLSSVNRFMSYKKSLRNSTAYAETSMGEPQILTGITNPRGMWQSEQVRKLQLMALSGNASHPSQSAGGILSADNGRSDHIGTTSTNVGQAGQSKIQYRQRYSISPIYSLNTPRPTATEASEGGGGFSRENTSATTTASFGDIFIDGNMLGRWVVRHLERVLTRPTLGSTGVDPRVVAAWPGMPIAS